MSRAVQAATTALPLDAERSALLDRLVDGLDPAALQWLSGYVAGLARGQAPARAANEPLADGQATILYGSQTGNGRRIAERLKAELDGAGLPARLASTADFRARDLVGERLLYLVVSTHGEGDPPDDARAFTEFLLGKRAPRLEQLSYAVLALGDSSYPKFCETGRVLDERLAELGARRLFSRIEADVDFDGPATGWLEQSCASARAELGATRLALVRPLRAATAPGATRDAPAEIEVLANQPVTAAGASRAVQHLELALPAAGFAYEPGDALGVWPVNPPAAVARIVGLTGAAADSEVTHGGRSLPLAQWLSTEREITRLTRPFIVAHAARARDAGLSALLEAGRESDLRDLLRRWQVAELIAAHPADWSPEDLVAALRPLAPRLYSIASSRSAVGDEAHLTVAVLDEDDAAGGRRQGAASSHLAGLAADDGRVRAFIEPNPRFRLPADPSRDVIMIGAGTGVAPYRGFLQERVESGASGRQWLVFGGRHLASDFLYQAEWLEALRKGTLHRLDVAFSRDQPEKRYVQHVLAERGALLYAWLEGGATLYVCGDAERMAPDVDTALATIIATHGGRSPDGAREYLRELAADKRYLRDVY